MNKLYIYTAQTADYPEDGEILHWEAWDVPQKHYSLPDILQKHLLDIRTEHARWAYDMPHKIVSGISVEEWFRAGESLSLWWCSLLYERHPKMTPHLYPVYKLRALELWLTDRAVSHIHIVGGDNLLRHTLEQFCKLTGRTFSCEGRITSNPLSRKQRLYKACPPLLRSVLRLGVWWWTVRRHLPFTGDAPLADISGVPRGSNTAVIATYFPNIDITQAESGRFRSRYWESLHEALDEHGAPGIRWLFIRFPSPQGSLEQCIQWRNAFRENGTDGVSFDYVEEFLAAADILAAWGRYRRIAQTSRKLAEALRGDFRFAGSHMLFWEYMAEDWQESFEGWRCLERCLQQRGIANYVRRVGPQRWFTFPLENCPWERMLTHAVHSSPDNGPVYGAQHSTIRPTDFRYFDDPRTFEDETTQAFQPDRILANGHSALTQWQAAHVPPARLGEVEALRYQYLTQQPDAVAPATRPRLLVVTSFFADETEAHAALLARSIQNGLLEAFEIIVKPHPYLPVEECLRTLLGDDMQRISFADGPIAAQLLPGTVVWASNSTTVALEAALRGLPLMVMQPCGDFDLCPLQDVPGLVRTGSLEDVRTAFANGTPQPLQLDPAFLQLDAALPRWRRLLGLPCTGQQS